VGGLFKRKNIEFLFFKFFLEFAFAAGFFSATSLFISRVGTFSLFYIYLGSSVLALGLSYLFSKIIDKYSRRLIFFSSFPTLGLTVILGWFLVHAYPDWRPIYYGIRIFSYSILVLTGLEFWVLASLTFTHSDSKKMFSQLVVVTILGEMAGGFFTSLTSHWIGTQNLLLVWGVFLCLIPFLFIRFSFPRPETAGFSTGVIWGEVQAPGTGFRSRSFFSSRLIQLLLCFWVLYSFICYGTDYVFNSFAVQNIQSEDSLTAFFGKVSAGASMAVLFYHLVIGPRLIHRLGPTQNLFLVTGIMLLPWILFALHPSLIMIAIADGVIFYFSDHFATGIYSTVLTVFPERVKGRIRVLTDGFGRPLGTFLLFAVAAIFAFQVSVHQMTYLMLLGTVALFCYPLLFRKPYDHHILNCLQSRDASLVLNSVQALSESPQSAAIEPLGVLLKDSKSMELRRSAIWALEHIQNPDAMQKILPILANPKDPLHVSAIDGLKYSPDFQGVYTLLGMLLRDQEKDPVLRNKSFGVLKEVLGKEVIIFLLRWLYDPDPDVQCDALKNLASFKDRRLISIFLGFLKNENPRLRACASIALYPFSRSREDVRKLALSQIEALVSSPKPLDKLAGIEAIGMVGLKSYQGVLLESLKSIDKSQVIAAVLALARLRVAAFVEPYIALLLNEDEEVAVEAGRRIEDFGGWGRKILFHQIAELEDVQQAKIQRRIKKTFQGSIADLVGGSERDQFLAPQIH